LKHIPSGIPKRGSKESSQWAKDLKSHRKHRQLAKKGRKHNVNTDQVLQKNMYGELSARERLVALEAHLDESIEFARYVTSRRVSRDERNRLQAETDAKVAASMVGTGAAIGGVYGGVKGKSLKHGAKGALKGAAVGGVLAIPGIIDGIRERRMTPAQRGQRTKRYRKEERAEWAEEDAIAKLRIPRGAESVNAPDGETYSAQEIKHYRDRRNERRRNGWA
jgi:hypothetical protein